MKHSFVTIGRNDDYGMIPGMDGPHFIDRLRYCHQSLQDLGGDAELIFVSVGDFPKEKLLPGVKLIVVPEETIQDKYPGYNFPMAYLLNVGIRAAQGDYITVHAADDIFGPNTLEVMALYATPRQIYTIAKFYASHETLYNGKVFWQGTTTPGEMLEVLWPRRDAWPWQDGINLPPGTRAYDVLGMHRDEWSYLRGFDEMMPGAGWIDQQMVLRALQVNFSFLDLATVGARIWHLDHLKQDAHPTFVLNPRFQRHPISNGVDWGCV